MDQATKADIEELRAGINKSFREIVRMYLSVKNKYEALEKRIELHNVRSGHKI